MQHQGLYGRTAAIPWHVPSIASYNTYAFPLAPRYIDATIIRTTTRLCQARFRVMQFSVVCSIPPFGKGAIVSGSIFAWRWRFQIQAVNMSTQCRFRGPATEVEAQHLIRPLGRGSSDPQADQQARNKGRIHLEAHPVEPLAQQMPAAQHTFDPAEKQLSVPLRRPLYTQVMRRLLR
jgi:hypothetical protein